MLAHELGHDQLHRLKYKNAAPFQENKVFNPTNRLELEANIFACHLLISDDDVLHVLRFGHSDMEMAAELV
ncbi:ImmA/IrrE family metallo-endopeptidase [Murdochiella massiliensis]|uniref:ImmA/IrrE family metallo-endopeptidase n=1 Tax=Murdochiella massiliensis TaxID=1673723 RepID=UPI0021CBC5D7|nr:ImmA/IrrE family metallo-endopeptidase [Murdochiella massiliensis]